MHCHHHSDRESVAICPECARPFCRECITEHEFRVICAGCLAGRSTPTETPEKAERSLPRVPVFPALQAAAGFFVVYTVFHATGDVLARLPTSYHEGSYMEGVIEFIKDPTQFDDEA